jgi:hypothetical protein
MRRFYLILLIFVICFTSYSQNSNNFKITPVNKKTKEFKDKFDLSSVLSSIVTYEYTKAFGRNSLYCKLSVERNIIYWPTADLLDSKMTETEINKILNHVIIETIEYKDSIACTIVQTGKYRFSIRWYEYDNHKWLNSGDDTFSSEEECRKLFYEYAEINLNELRRVNLISELPTDTLPFVDYLLNNGQKPKEFMIDAIKKHKLVIYGETHCLVLK